MDAITGMSRNVLVIDDHELVRKSLSIVLSLAGHTVSTAESGDTGIKKLQNGDFDVVITDLEMDDVNGLDVARAAKEIHPDLPVILISGTQKNVESISGFNFVNTFFRKPMEIHQVIVSVERLASEYRNKF